MYLLLEGEVDYIKINYMCKYNEEPHNKKNL